MKMSVLRLVFNSKCLTVSTQMRSSFYFGMSTRAHLSEILEDVKVLSACSYTNITFWQVKTINHPCEDNQMKIKISSIIFPCVSLIIAALDKIISKLKNK